MEAVPTVVFDLDGCLSQNPYDHPHISTGIYDENFWRDHWTDPGVPCHPELVQMAQSLLHDGHRIIILTARPRTFIKQTMAWLGRVGHWGVIETQPDAPPTLFTSRRVVYLIMHPGDEICRHSGAWKRDTCRKLSRHYDIQFVVEDFKPNADLIRTVCPVLLYERKKGYLPDRG